MKQKVLMLAALFAAGAAHGDIAHPNDEANGWCDHLSVHEYLEQTDELEVMTADELEELMAADGVAVDEIADVPVKPFPVDAPEQEVVRDAPEQGKVKAAPEQNAVEDVAKQEEIAEESGFSSRTAYYKARKRVAAIDDNIVKCVKL